MMHGSITVFTVNDVMASLAYYHDQRGAKMLKASNDYDFGLRDFDVADLDGNMIFFGMESEKAS
jgi:hypothetical protein